MKREKTKLGRRSVRWQMLAICAFLIIGTVSVFGKGQGEAPKQKGIVLQYWNGFTGPDGQYLQTIVNKFNAENKGSIYVKMVVMPWADYMTKRAIALKSGTKDAPDIGNVTENYIPTMVKLNFLIPLTPYLDKIGIKKADINPRLWALQFINGTSWGMPTDMNPQAVLYWNKDLFKAVGLDPNTPPRDRKEFLKFSKMMTQGSGKNKQWGTAMPTGWPNNLIWYSIFRSNGGRLFNPNHTTATFGGPAGLDALQFMYNLVYVDKVAQPNIDGNSVLTNFRSGHIGMVSDGLWMLSSLMKTPKLNLGVALIPKLGSKKQAVATAANFIMIFNKSGQTQERIDACVKFLHYVNANIIEWMKSYKLPPRNSMLTDPAYLALPYMKDIAKDADKVVFANYFPSFQAATQPLWEALNIAITGTKSPQKALAAAVKASNQVLKKGE